MKKGIAVVATSLLLFVGCTEDKKEAKEEVAPKQEVTQNVTNTGSGTTIFQDDVIATNVNVNTGTSTFQDNLTATTTTITTGNVKFSRN